MHTVISTLRRYLGDDAGNPTYIFTETRLGCRMPKDVEPETATQRPSVLRLLGSARVCSTRAA